jgi:hypothetical protein
MTQKMLFFFTNISAEILPHILGYSICIEQLILVHFCQMLLQKLLYFGNENVG